VKVLEIFGDNKSKAAEVLGISRTSLWRILKEE
jgi:DNA-binding protein Fis